MAVKPLSLTQKFGRVTLALAVTLFLTNTASAVIQCVSTKHVQEASCCAEKAAQAKEKGCCCEVSSTEGNPAVIAKAISADELAQIVSALPSPIPSTDRWSVSTVDTPRPFRERPPPQIVLIRLAPKRAPPCA